jgi:hypothetical protein
MAVDLANLDAAPPCEQQLRLELTVDIDSRFSFHVIR